MINDMFQHQELARYVAENDLPWPVVKHVGSLYTRVEWDLPEAEEPVRIRAVWLNQKRLLTDFGLTFLSNIGDEREWGSIYVRPAEGHRILQSGEFNGLPGP